MGLLLEASAGAAVARSPQLRRLLQPSGLGLLMLLVRLLRLAGLVATLLAVSPTPPPMATASRGRPLPFSGGNVRRPTRSISSTKSKQPIGIIPATFHTSTAGDRLATSA